MDFRERTHSDFGIVFGDSTAGDESEEVIVQDTFQSNWSWFGMMHRLTNGDITKLEVITKTSLFECLTWLTYETELQEQTNFNNKPNE